MVMKRVWWFFHGHKLQADKPHDDLLQMMNVDFSTRSTYKGVVPTNYDAADRHQWLVWISPGLVLNPSINRTRTESICTESWVNHLHLDVTIETPNIWLPSRAGELFLEEMWVSGRGRTEWTGSWLTRKTRG